MLGFLTDSIWVSPSKVRRLNQGLSVGFPSGTISSWTDTGYFIFFISGLAALSCWSILLGSANRFLTYSVIHSITVSLLGRNVERCWPKQIHSNTTSIRSQGSLLSSFRYLLQRKHAAKVSMIENNSQVQYLFLHEQKKTNSKNSTWTSLGQNHKAHLFHLSALKCISIHLLQKDYFKDPREYLSILNNFKYQGTVDALNSKPPFVVTQVWFLKARRRIGYQLPYNLRALETLFNHPLALLKAYS